MNGPKLTLGKDLVLLRPELFWQRWTKAIRRFNRRRPKSVNYKSLPLTQTSLGFQVPTCPRAPLGAFVLLVPDTKNT